jgi:hypothetical protein
MEVALMSLELYNAGYRAVSFENNPTCIDCAEYTFVRLQCPELQWAKTLAADGDDSRNLSLQDLAPESSV